MDSLHLEEIANSILDKTHSHPYDNADPFNSYLVSLTYDLETCFVKSL